MIPFNKPFLTGVEYDYIKDAHLRGSLAGRGHYSTKCTEWLESNLGVKKAFLTHSCTAALEMCALLLKLNVGDEVIMPSFTFVSTANAFVLRGAVPVFVDILPDSLNINPVLVEQAITPRTKAVVAVHYAGVACDMHSLSQICKAHNLTLIEDAAQAILSKDSSERYLGSVADLSAISFHETKNIMSGEGGALLINNESFINQAAIVLEKGTDRILFQHGLASKYTWQGVGSSYTPSELIAAFLYAQLQHAFHITAMRHKLWNRYMHELTVLLDPNRVQLPSIHSFNGSHNAHIFHLRCDSNDLRDRLIAKFSELGVQTVFHYIPLHSSPAGINYGRALGDLSVTNNVSSTLLRLPLWIGLDQDYVLETISAVSEELN